MAFPVLADLAISLTDFKRDPIGAVREGQGETVLVLDDDQPAFYAVPPEQYLALLEQIDDLQLSELVRHRQGETVVAVDLDDLIDEAIDTSDIPELDEDFFRRAELRVPVKHAVTLRLDADVLEWFKGQGAGYQTRINQVLRRYMHAQLGQKS